MKWVIAGFIVLGLFASGCGFEEEAEPTPPTPEMPDIEPVQPSTESVVDKWDLWNSGTLLRGANLHPSRLFISEDNFEPITRQDVQELRNLGANVINASYPGVFTELPPYQVNPQTLAYLDELIGWAEEIGIYVVINFRTGPGRNEAAIQLQEGAMFDVWTEQDAHDAWVEMWRFTAERYHSSPIAIGYCIMVEPHVNTLIDPDWEMEPEDIQAGADGTLMDWNAFAVEITAAIREIDTDTPIIMDSLNWADSQWFQVLEPTGDPRTVYGFHAYNPDAYINQDVGEISITYPDVVEVDGERITFDRSWVEDDLQPVVEFADEYHVPIFVGEHGTFRWVPGAKEFLQDQMSLFEQYGWNYAYYVWRGNEEYFDGFDMEYGTDPNNHTAISDNPLLGIFLRRWAQNTYFPGHGAELGSAGERSYRQDMRGFVQDISAYAKALSTDFIVIPQNGHELLAEDAETCVPATAYLKAIDGVGQEDLFYGYDEDNVATPISEGDYMISLLNIAENNGVEVLVTDYCSTPSFMGNSYRQNAALGYISFAADHHELDNIPPYPPNPFNMNASEITSLIEAKNFLYLINPDSYSSLADFLNALRSTNYDVIIIDAFYWDNILTADSVVSLKVKNNGGDRLVIAYMSIGEAENYRYYWQDEWDSSPPTWLSKENPNWTGNYKVRYWERGWQEIIYGTDDAYLDKVVNAGFDGVYLDIIDAFEYFEDL